MGVIVKERLQTGSGENHICEPRWADSISLGWNVVTWSATLSHSTYVAKEFKWRCMCLLHQVLQNSVDCVIWPVVLNTVHTKASPVCRLRWLRWWLSCTNVPLMIQIVFGLSLSCRLDCGLSYLVLITCALAGNLVASYYSTDTMNIYLLKIWNDIAPFW